jgi:hypothetical protein
VPERAAGSGRSHPARRPHRVRKTAGLMKRPRPKGILAVLAAVVLLAAAGVAGFLIGDEDEAEPLLDGPAPAPTVIVEQAPEPEAADQLGFPGFATRNTTRVGGADPIADAAGVALASYPAVGGVEGPGAAVIAPADSWQIALASASLAAEPVGAPILLGEPDAVPEFTAAAFEGLAPVGLGSDRIEVIAVGDVAVPDGAKSLEIDGAGPAEVAKAIDTQRAKLSKLENPDHLLVVSEDAPEFAMPAAAWAARSGDPILFASKEEVPEATVEVIERHPKAAVFVLGPPSAIGSKALEELEKAAGRVTRVGATDPVENAIAFARFSAGSFGWEIADPGAARHRRCRRGPPGAARLLARHQARLPRRARARRLQPHLAARRQRGGLAALPGPGRRADQARAGPRGSRRPALRHRRAGVRPRTAPGALSQSSRPAPPARDSVGPDG